MAFTSKAATAVRLNFRNREIEGRPRTERPQLVEQIVVRDGHLGRQDGRGEQRHPRRPVQQEQEEAVDPDADEADDEEPPQSMMIAKRGRRPPCARHRPVRVQVHPFTGFEGQDLPPQSCAHPGRRHLHYGH